VQLPLLLLFFSPCFSFLFLHEQWLRDGHGACGMRLTPAGCQGLGAGAAVLIAPTSSFFFHSSLADFWCSGGVFGGGGIPKQQRGTGRPARHAL
jgi:hypothetical protein